MKKTIYWYEKRGKGSYWDPKLNHFINVPTHGFNDEVPPTPPAFVKRTTWWTKILGIIKNLFNGMK